MTDERLYFIEKKKKKATMGKETGRLSGTRRLFCLADSALSAGRAAEEQDEENQVSVLRRAQRRNWDGGGEGGERSKEET